MEGGEREERKGTTRGRTKTTFPDRLREREREAESEPPEMRLESIRIHLRIPSSPLPFLFIAPLNRGMAEGSARPNSRFFGSYHYGGTKIAD